MSIVEFEKVPREEAVQRLGGQFNAAIEAAIADPASAVKIVGLTSKQRATLAGAVLRGLYAGQCKARCRKQPDGTYTAILTAVSG